jgi:hypothetical protein
MSLYTAKDLTQFRLTTINENTAYLNEILRCVHAFSFVLLESFALNFSIVHPQLTMTLRPLLH